MQKLPPVYVKCDGVSKFDEVKIPPHKPTRERFNSFNERERNQGV